MRLQFIEESVQSYSAEISTQYPEEITALQRFSADKRKEHATPDWQLSMSEVEELRRLVRRFLQVLNKQDRSFVLFFNLAQELSKSSSSTLTVSFFNYQVAPKFNFLFKLADDADFWKLAIDGRFHGKGKTFFDESRPEAEGEKGYVECVNKAFRNALIPSLGVPLSVDVIIGFHDALVNGVKKEIIESNGARRLEESRTGLRCPETKDYPFAVGFYVYMQGGPDTLNLEEITLTMDGAKEIYLAGKDKHEKEYYPYRLHIVNCDKTRKFQCIGETIPNEFYLKCATKAPRRNFYGFSVLTCEQPRKTLVECLEFHIQKYKNEMQMAGSDNIKKLQAICRFLSTVERIHPFYDGNCRTVYFLLHKLLIDNNFPPSLLDNPNIFDGLAVNELVEKVILGMDKFASCFPHVVFPSPTISRDALKAALKESMQIAAVPQSIMTSI
jgi:hypothetical protein